MDVWKQVVKVLHGGQKDKQGQPYYLHPFAVAEKTVELYVKYFMKIRPPSLYNLDSLYKVALFHDVLEDTNTTMDNLRNLGLHPTVIHVVDILSCDHKDKKFFEDGVTKKPYRWRIQEIINTDNLGAMLVKLADNLHNDDPGRRLEYTHKKYVETIPMLVLALGLPPSDFAEYFPDHPDVKYFKYNLGIDLNKAA